MLGVKSQSTLGILERVAIPSLGIKKILAKIDTGAYSGAIHCTDIKVVRIKSENKRILKFKPLGKAKLATETENFIEKHVRSASGHRNKRYLVEVTVNIDGREFKTMIGLADRTEMKRRIILGRRFLRENNILVDVRKNQELDDERESL